MTNKSVMTSFLSIKYVLVCLLLVMGVNSENLWFWIRIFVRSTGSRGAACGGHVLMNHRTSHWSILMYSPRRHSWYLTQRWVIGGPASLTLAHQWPSAGSMLSKCLLALTQSWDGVFNTDPKLTPRWDNLLFQLEWPWVVHLLIRRCHIFTDTISE